MSFFHARKVVVTGAAGLLGTKMVTDLLDRGAVVRAVIRNRHLPEDIVSHPNLEVVHADLSSYENCIAVTKGQDFAVLGACKNPGSSGIQNDPMHATIRNLVIASYSFQASCVNGLKRVLFPGSACLYPSHDTPVKEELGHQGEPDEAFEMIGNTYRYLEKMATFLHNSTKTKFALLRLAPFYGPYDSFDIERCHVIPALILKAKRRMNPFSVWGSGDVVRDFVFVDDISRACLLALESYAQADPVNIGSGVGTTINELVKTVLKTTEHDVPIEFDTSRPTTNRYRVLDTEHAQKTLDFQTQISVEEGILRTVNWIQGKEEAFI